MTHFYCENQIFSESDLDGDRQISFVEFDNVVKKSPDFMQ